MHLRACVLGLAALGAAAPTTAHAKLILDRIIVHAEEGTSKTSAAAVEARMRLHRGDVIEFGILGVAQDRLIASDLFQTAEVYLDMPREHAVELMYLTDKVYSVDVHVKVKEKHSWFVIPNASFGGGDQAGGIVYVDQNLAGTGTQLIAAGQVGLIKSFGFVGFRDPIATFAPITYGFGAIARRENFLFYEDHQKAMHVPTDIWGGEAQLGYVFSSHMRALGGVMFNRIKLKPPEDIDPSIPMPSYNQQSGDAIVLQLYVIYDRTMAPEGLRRGAKIHLKNEISDAFWNSDFDYAKLEFQAEYYGYLLKTYPSVVFRSIVNYPTSDRGVPLTQMLRLGGGDLRGYLVNEFRGDTLVTMQLEDQVPVFTGLRVPWTKVKLNIAAAAFIDTGALLERHPDGRVSVMPGATAAGPRPEIDDFHTSVGLGVRLLLPGVAIPAVKIDFGYGIDVNDTAITISVAGGGL